MRILKANIKDFNELYEMAKRTKEFQVSNKGPIVSKEEFKWMLKNKKGIFLVAIEGTKIIGFIYVNAKDLKKNLKNKYACLTYITVLKEYRKRGIAQKLYSNCEERLKKWGINNIYVWANVEGKGEIISFMKKQHFIKGHKYLWMDKKIMFLF